MINKVLLITGTSYCDQKMIEDSIIKSDLNFVSLNLSLIFHKVAKDISKEYFAKEIDEVEGISGFTFINYLDLLNFLQKTVDKRLIGLYKRVYKSSQIVNELIMFRLYREYFIEAKKIVDSGKNCVFFENIFNDPFPGRKDIFLDYFKFFTDDFKILNVYTSIKSMISQIREDNSEFIEYFSGKKDVKLAYNELIEASITRTENLPRLENPLFNLELYPLMFNISNKKDPIKDVFEVIDAKVLKTIYKLSILEMKKQFGFTVLKSYPIFYPKVSLLNEVGSEFVYIKNFHDIEKLYITNNRLIFDLNLNIANKNAEFELNRFFQVWLNRKTHISLFHFSVKDLLPNDTIEKKIHILSTKIKEEIKCIINSERVFFIDSWCSLDPAHFSRDNGLYSKINLEYFFFIRHEDEWRVCVLVLQRNGQVKLYIEPNAENFDESLIFINNLYVSIYRIKEKHFFINRFNLDSRRKNRILKKTLNILNNGY